MTKRGCINSKACGASPLSRWYVLMSRWRHLFERQVVDGTRWKWTEITLNVVVIKTKSVRQPSWDVSRYNNKLRMMWIAFFIVLAVLFTSLFFAELFGVYLLYALIGILMRVVSYFAQVNISTRDINYIDLTASQWLHLYSHRSKWLPLPPFNWSSSFISPQYVTLFLNDF